MTIQSTYEGGGGLLVSLEHDVVADARFPLAFMGRHLHICKLLASLGDVKHLNVVLAHGHPEISNLLAILASGRKCARFWEFWRFWEFFARDQEERYLSLSRRFKVVRIGGRFLHVCTTSHP